MLRQGSGRANDNRDPRRAMSGPDGARTKLRLASLCDAGCRLDLAKAVEAELYDSGGY
jgi:hypothetical protein